MRPGRAGAVGVDLVPRQGREMNFPLEHQHGSLTTPRTRAWESSRALREKSLHGQGEGLSRLPRLMERAQTIWGERAIQIKDGDPRVRSARVRCCPTFTNLFAALSFPHGSTLLARAYDQRPPWQCRPQRRQNGGPPAARLAPEAGTCLPVRETSRLGGSVYRA